MYKLKTADGTNLQEVTNYYNANGERTKQIEVNKKVTDTNTSVPGLETRYFYNNGKLLFTTDQNHTLVEDNLLDPSGQIIFTKRNDGNYANKYFFYSHDTRGSVSNIINPEGKLIKGYSYDEFGDTEERGDKAFKNSVKFIGAVNVNSTGLYYMNARFYNPSTTIFLTQDSYTGNPYEPRTQHLYSYCANDPINYTDPTGHMMRRDAEDGGSTPDPLQTYLDNRVKLGGGGSSSTLPLATRQAWNGLNDTFKYEGVISNFIKNIDKGISKASDAANNNILLCIVPLILEGNPQALEKNPELFESNIPRIEGIVLGANKPFAIDRIKNVAQKGFDYAVEHPRVEGLNRMQLGKDAEIQATRWTRKWAERNGIELSESGLKFQVRGAHSIPDVVYEPTQNLIDFKFTPKAIRKVQSNNFKSDFQGYSIEYIFGPGLWRK